MLDRTVLTMAALRFLSSTLEAAAALAMLYFNDVRSSLQVNAILGLTGPAILTLVTAVGLFSAAERMSFGKILLVLGGVALILLGTR